MRRTLAALAAAVSALNGLMMLIDGQGWYARVPGVTDTGPFNGHFIQDIGMAFLVAGLALAARAWRPRYWPAGLAGAGFLAGHAAIHLAGLLAGHAHHAAFDLVAIIIPAALALYSAIPTQEDRHA